MNNKHIDYNFPLRVGEEIVIYDVLFDHHIDDNYTFIYVYRRAFDKNGNLITRLDGNERVLIDSFEIRDSNEKMLTEDYARSYLAKLLKALKGHY